MARVHAPAPVFVDALPRICSASGCLRDATPGHRTCRACRQKAAASTARRRKLLGAKPYKPRKDNLAELREVHEKRRWYASLWQMRENEIDPYVDAVMAFVRTPEFVEWYEAEIGVAWDHGRERDPHGCVHFLLGVARRLDRRAMTAGSLPARAVRMRLATPKWADKDQIRLIYEQRRLLDRLDREGGPYHVDHIVPIAGPNVCGLHVHYNLRIIPARESLEKRNKLLDWVLENL